MLGVLSLLLPIIFINFIIVSRKEFLFVSLLNQVFSVKVSKYGATFGNVLKAKANGNARPRREGLKPFREFYDEEEWKYLEDLHEFANPHQHIGKMPSRLVLPRRFYFPEMVQNIAVKADCIQQVSDLEVEDEENTSSGSLSF